MIIADDGKPAGAVPRSVAILGMGPTIHDYIGKKLQEPHPGGFVDQVWGLNNVSATIACDLCFIMDDFVEMLERPHPKALFWDTSNPLLMQWAREAKIPILTSRAYKDKYPTTINFPLDEVLTSIFGSTQAGFNLNNSTAYAIAYAWFIGVKQIYLYGCDFGYPWHDPYERRRTLEASRANVESLLLAGSMLGKFTFHVSAGTSLFDTNEKRPFYGYADGRRAVPDSMIPIPKQEEVQNDNRILPPETGPGRNPGLTAGTAGAVADVSLSAPASVAVAGSGGTDGAAPAARAEAVAGDEPAAASPASPVYECRVAAG